MMSNTTLQAVFDSCEYAVVACSGGVDSMTLAYCAHRGMQSRVRIFHALSAAVPAAATERVKAYAAREGWQLTVLDAGEFNDESYRRNPANRCFYCKSHLYDALAQQVTDTQLFSGTNTDDLGDWRPGLQAAANNAVRHPFVEAGMAKSDVRALAAKNNLQDIAELPSSPCLSSRIETGIRIETHALHAIDKVETLLRNQLKAATVRCRVRSEGIVIELDEHCLAQLNNDTRTKLQQDIRQLFNQPADTRVAFESYRRGSAFLKETLVTLSL